jgi:hypothetical protein
MDTQIRETKTRIHLSRPCPTHRPPNGTAAASSSHCLASQHIKGDENVVSDLLSFAGNVRGYDHPLALDFPSDATLTQRFHDHLPQLIPQNFVISLLTSEISSFVTRALQMTESSLSLNKKSLTKNVTEPGDDGPPSAPNQASTLTPSSLEYQNPKKSSSFEPSSPFTESLASWHQSGSLLGQRPRPVVRDAASHLAALFRSHFQQSPFHLEGSTQLLPTVRSLLKAFDNADPPPQRQKAITPKCLRRFYRLLTGKTGSVQHPAYAQTANITLGAYFFAM